MTELWPVALQVRDSEREPVRALLEVERLSPAHRVERAGLWVVGSLLLAVFAVFVPVFRYVLVPAVLVVGPLLAARAYRKTVVLKPQDVTCPKCGRASAIEPNRMGWPAVLRCPLCSATFRVHSAFNGAQPDVSPSPRGGEGRGEG